jgi:hypothetical protein
MCHCLSMSRKIQWESSRSYEQSLRGKVQATPTFAERALAPVSSFSYGIDPIANPYLNHDPGTIIVFPGEIFRVVEIYGLLLLKTSAIFDKCKT